MAHMQSAPPTYMAAGNEAGKYGELQQPGRMHSQRCPECEGLGYVYVEDAPAVPGIKAVKSARKELKNTLMERLSTRYASGRRPTLDGPEDAFRRVRDLSKEPQEVFVLLSLDSKKHLLAKHVISIGGLNTNSAHPREVFRSAIIDNAAAVILAHNHPSGDATPSREDISVTKLMENAAGTLGIELLDHMVVGHGGFTSLRREGLI